MPVNVAIATQGLRCQNFGQIARVKKQVLVYIFRIEINGEQKIKKVHIDPARVDLDDIHELERWLEDAVKEAISQSQKVAAEKMQPMMGALGSLGL